MGQIRKILTYSGNKIQFLFINLIRCIFSIRHFSKHNCPKFIWFGSVCLFLSRFYQLKTTLKLTIYGNNRGHQYRTLANRNQFLTWFGWIPFQIITDQNIAIIKMAQDFFMNVVFSYIALYKNSCIQKQEIKNSAWLKIENKKEFLKQFTLVSILNVTDQD